MLNIRHEKNQLKKRAFHKNMTHYCRLHSVGCHRIVYDINIDVFLYHSQYVKRKHNKSCDIFSGSFTHVVTPTISKKICKIYIYTKGNQCEIF